MISHIDENIGRVLVALEANGYLNDTIIVFLSDHGDLMGDHWLINKGAFPFDGLVRVPTIWKLPDTPSADCQSNAFVSAVDFLPTVLDLAGIDIPNQVQGISYGPVLRGEVDTTRNNIYIEFDDSYLNDRVRHLRTDDYALTTYAHLNTGLLYALNTDPREL